MFMGQKKKLLDHFFPEESPSEVGAVGQNIWKTWRKKLSENVDHQESPRQEIRRHPSDGRTHDEFVPGCNDI